MQQTGDITAVKKAILFQLTDDAAGGVSEALKGQKIAAVKATHLADVRRLLKADLYDFLFVGSSYLLKRGGSLIPSIKKAEKELSIIICVCHEDREKLLPLLSNYVAGVLLEPYYTREILFVLNATDRITRSEIEDRVTAELVGHVGNPHRVFIGRSPNAHQVRREAVAAKNGRRPVYFVGENGTGKSQLSLCVHVRPKEPFSPIRFYDPFGDPQRKRGILSVIGQIPSSGTLVVKNTQHLSAREAATLDVFLKRGQESAGKTCRIILHYDPSFEMAERFDRSLFGNIIEIGPLRQRPEDIGAIFGYYTNCFSTILGVPPITVTRATRKMLTQYQWPRNVRELIGVVSFAVVSGSGGTVDPHMLPDFITRDDPDPLERISLDNLLTSKLKPIVSKMNPDKVRGLYNIVLARVEAPLIKIVLEQTGNNQSKAARVLGINRNTLKKKIDAYRIER
jgi:two-component system nitrogen regulation response regulator GlnG